MINAAMKQCVQDKLYINLQCVCVWALFQKGTSMPALLHAVFCISNYTGLPSCHFNDDANP